MFCPSGGRLNFATKIQKYKIETRESGKESLKEFSGTECARYLTSVMSIFREWSIIFAEILLNYSLDTVWTIA